MLFTSQGVTVTPRVSSLGVPLGPSASGVVSDLITICIPSYRRPTFLLRCLYSCLLQDFRALGIDISDNSTTFETGKLVEVVPLPAGVKRRYWWTQRVHVRQGGDSSRKQNLVTARSNIGRLGGETGFRRDLLVCAFWRQIFGVGFLVLTEAARKWHARSLGSRPCKVRHQAGESSQRSCPRVHKMVPPFSRVLDRLPLAGRRAMPRRSSFSAYAPPPRAQSRQAGT